MLKKVGFLHHISRRLPSFSYESDLMLWILIISFTSSLLLRVQRRKVTKTHFFLLHPKNCKNCETPVVNVRPIQTGFVIKRRGIISMYIIEAVSYEKCGSLYCICCKNLTFLSKIIIGHSIISVASRRTSPFCRRFNSYICW